jgi:phospholipid transport system transporter-binding protein
MLPASVTLKEVSAVLRTVEAALAGPADGPLRVDASAVAELDTSAVSLLLQAQRLAMAAGRTFELVAPPDKLVALARLYGVASLLSIDDGNGEGSGNGTGGVPRAASA